MDLGIFTASDDIDDLVAQAREVSDAGFRSMWMPQVFGVDSITALAVVAREVPGLELGTAVVPTYPRHPAMLATQAATVSAISGGRFTLGIGLSHQLVIEGMFGMTWERPVRHMREYLDILLPLLDGEAAAAEGETLTYRGQLGFSPPPTPVLVAALGPAMLRLAGSRAAGTSTWMTGSRTIRDHVAPAIRAAAEEAGRPEPQVVVSVPVCVTDHAGAASERAATEFEMYGVLPSYRAMLDREGVDGPADIAVIGNAEQVAERLEGFFEAGATTVNAMAFGSRDDRDATWNALAGLLPG